MRILNLTNFYLLIACYFFAWQSVDSLRSIPRNAHTLARLWQCKSQDCSKADIEEFLNLDINGVRIDYKKYESISAKVGDVSTYFRLDQAGMDPPRGDDSIIMYDRHDELCSLKSLSEWPLNGLTNFLYHSANNGKTFNLLSDPILRQLSIGPMALLRFVHLNASKFKMTRRWYNNINLINNYYFTTDLLDLGSDKIKLVVLLPTRNVDPNAKTEEKIQIGKTLLSQVDTREHIAAIGFFIASNQEETKDLTDAPLTELLDSASSANSSFSSYIMQYNLIETLSLSQIHVGQLAQDATGVFSLPIGSGCGLLLPDSEPLYIKARQFSGRFEARGFPDQYYIAYDEFSRLLRYDSIDEFKMIYSQDEKSVTMISTNEDDLSLSLTNGEHHVKDKSHCAYYKLQDTKDASTSSLFRAKSMSEILGFGSEVGLGYLGAQTIDNDLTCLVYEREITADKIPALLLMHGWPSIKDSDRYFLDYFFVAQSIDPEESRYDYESMRLKRIQLISFNKKHQAIKRSQLTFDEFSWSIELDDGASLGELAHPVRVFDTVECNSLQNQIFGQMSIRQMEDSEWRFSTSKNNLREQFENGMSSFEHYISRVISFRIGLASSHVNQLDVIMNDKSDDLLLRTTITRPLDYQLSTTLLGWVYQVDSMTQVLGENAKNELPAAELIKDRVSMSIEECTLRVSTGLGHELQHRLHVIVCPLVGCGFIRSFKWREVADKLLEANNSTIDRPPTIQSYPRMCSVYLVDRSLSSTYLSTVFSSERLIENLNGTQVQVLLPQQTDSDVLSTMQQFVGKIQDVSFRSALDHEQWDEQLQSNACLTTETYINLKRNYTGLSANDDRELKLFNDNLKILQLNFDKQHSIRHCHQACLMNQMCRVYSYDSETRQCFISNIEKEILMDNRFELKSSKQSKSCSLMALNQLSRYKTMMVSMVIKPIQLTYDRSPIVVTDLLTCASLCHRNEIPMTRDGKNLTKSSCASFVYVRSHSLCKLSTANDYPRFEQQDRRLDDFDLRRHIFEGTDYSHGMLHDKSELRAYMGDQTSNEVGHCEIYNREYGSKFFETKNNAKLVLQQPTNLSNGTDLAISLKYVNQFNALECMRQCIIIDRDCESFDYYNQISEHAKRYPRGASSERVCILYHFRSPLSIDQQLFASAANSTKLKFDKKVTLDENTRINGVELSQIESRLYMPKETEYGVGLEYSSGRHQYMNADSLFLKRILSIGASNSDSCRKDADPSLAPVEQVDSNSFDTAVAQSSKIHFTWLPGTLFHIMIGLTIGMIMFVVVNRFDAGSLGQFGELTNEIGSRLRSLFQSDDARFRRDRSLSQVELKEMEVGLS